MTRPPQHDLFVSERPLRSDFARERSYAIRRVITLTVLAAVIGGGIYAVWGRGPTNPADIPLIKAEGAYKQKPADPGGIDIPHQDVRVYDQLESHNSNAPPVEHLLPPPEVPKEAPLAVAPPPATAAPAPPVTPPIVPPHSTAAQPDAILSDMRPAKLVETTATPAPVPPPAAPPVAAATPAALVPKTTVAPKQEAMSIEQVIANTKNSAIATPAGNGSTGSVMIQLASVPDQAGAQEMAKNLQSKYASFLGGAVLRANRADLGKRGVFYRVQSQGLSESDAEHICAALKQNNAGCILVRK